MDEAKIRANPRTPEELKEQLIAECEAERDLAPEDIGKSATALDSPLAMRLWDEFLRR